jgi:anti-sigma B factor antagonist
MIHMTLIPQMLDDERWSPGQFSSFAHKESKVKLMIEIRAHEEVTVVRCKGRLVYREEAAALCEQVTDLLRANAQVVLDLSQVETIDGAGLGQLVILHMRAQANGGTLKLAAPSKRVLDLLALTNLASVFEVHPTLEEAVLSFRGQMV